MVNKSKIASMFFIALLLLCTVQPVFAATDSFNFNVNPGNNNLPLGTTYNGSFVTDISGVFEIPSPISDVEYLQELNVTSNMSRDNVLINITIPRNTSSMNANFSDLRFFYANLTEIPYFVSSYNASAANVSIKANLTSGLNQLYIGFGVPSAQSKSDINSIYLYRLNNSSGQSYTGIYTHFTGSYSNINLFTTPTSNIGEFAFWYFKTIGTNSTTRIPYIYNYYNQSTGGNLSASFNTSGENIFTNNTNGKNGYSHWFNLSPNTNGSVRLDYQKLRNGTVNQTLVINGNNTTNTPFQLFAHNGSITIYDVVIFNTTSNSYVLGAVSPAGGSENITIPIPSGLFSSLNFNAPKGGFLEFNITYTPHISEWNLDSVQPNGRLNFSYKPVDTQANYAWEVSSSSAFDQLVLNGIGTPSEINASGFANIYVTDFTNLTPGTYYWRLKSAETGNNTVFASKEFTVDSKKIIEIRIIDGVTGDWLNVSTQNQTSAVQIYPPVNFAGMTAGSFQGRTHSNIWNQINPANINSYNLTVTQGGNVQIKPLSVEKSGIHWATNTFEANIGEPLTVQINTGNYAWKNQTYIIPLENHTIQDGIFNLSIERPMSNNSTSTENLTNVTHGIVHDSRGEAIGTASFNVNNSSTGAFIGTFLVQNGGQYAYYNTSVTDSFYFSFFATGFASVSGAIDKIKQDILLLATPDITISLLDSDTRAPIQYFTTYLGDAQTIRSTDNGTVTYDNVSEGVHQVIIQADGYTQATRQIEVTPDNTEFILTIKRAENQTTWDEVNFVNFYILDQKGDYVYNTHVVITTLDGNRELYNQSVLGTAAFTVELNRSQHYVVHVTKPSEQVDETINIFGSSLSATMYLIVGKTTQPAPPNLQTGVQVSYNATTSQIVVTAKATDSRITNLYFQSINGTYIVSNTGQNGSLGNPSISSGNGVVTATWNVNGLEAGTVVTVDLVVKSNQTGEQELTARKTFLLKDGNGVFPDLFPDFGLSPGAREAVCIVILAVLALVSSSAGIPYASTLVPSMAYLVLAWAGWISWAPVYLVLIAIGILIVGYDMIKKTRM